MRTPIAQIARNAIQEIDRIAQIVRTIEPSSSSGRAERSSSSTSNETPSSSNSAGGSTSSDHSTGQSRPVLPSLSRVCDARDRNALTELRRRFLTLSSSNSAVARGGLVRRHGTNVGRPSGGSVIKDIIIVGAQVEKTPLGRRDKLLLESKNRVITGFTIEKRWNDTVLYDKIIAQFPEDCRNMDYEFVRNVYGTLVKPSLASGVKIDANILLKSIASSGAVYVRLFADDLDDPDYDWELSTSPFDMPAEGSGVLEHSLAELTSMEPIHVPSNEVID